MRDHISKKLHRPWEVRVAAPLEVQCQRNARGIRQVRADPVEDPAALQANPTRLEAYRDWADVASYGRKPRELFVNVEITDVLAKRIVSTPGPST